jgi:hypothetical protein
MTEAEFQEFSKVYFNNVIFKTMKEKGLGQYSTNEDRFHNFNQLAVLKQEPKEKCLTDLVAKQIVCLYDTMRNWHGNLTAKNVALLDELLKDIIVYSFILRGMFFELEQDLELK